MDKVDTGTGMSSPGRPWLAFGLGLASLILLVTVDDPPSNGRGTYEAEGEDIAVAVAGPVLSASTAMPTEEIEADALFPSAR